MNKNDERISLSSREVYEKTNGIIDQKNIMFEKLSLMIRLTSDRGANIVSSLESLSAKLSKTESAIKRMNKEIDKEINKLRVDNDEQKNV